MDARLMGPNRSALVHGPNGIVEKLEKTRMYQMDLARLCLVYGKQHGYYDAGFNNLKSLAITNGRILRGIADMDHPSTKRDIRIMAEVLDIL